MRREILQALWELGERSSMAGGVFGRTIRQCLDATVSGIAALATERMLLIRTMQFGLANRLRVWGGAHGLAKLTGRRLYIESIPDTLSNIAPHELWSVHPPQLSTGWRFSVELHEPGVPHPSDAMHATQSALAVMHHDPSRWSWGSNETGVFGHTPAVLQTTVPFLPKELFDHDMQEVLLFADNMIKPTNQSCEDILRWRSESHRSRTLQPVVEAVVRSFMRTHFRGKTVIGVCGRVRGKVCRCLTGVEVR